jgi:hypothetical protein
MSSKKLGIKPLNGKRTNKKLKSKYLFKNIKGFYLQNMLHYILNMPIRLQPITDLI